MKTIRDFDLNNKVVFLRVDFNLPVNKEGEITSEKRLIASLETIKYAIDKGAKLVLLSHFGRVKEPKDKLKYSLKKVVQLLSNHLNQEVKFLKSYKFQALEFAINQMNSGDVLVLENTRFLDLDGNLESKCNDELSQEWAKLADVYINDAFGTCHRKHASTYGIAKYVKEKGIGFLVEKEVEAINKVITNPERPLIAILGGAKVSDKIKLIENLAQKCDKVLIGGAMALTFKKALNCATGESLVELDQVPRAKELIEKYKDKIILPTDFACSQVFENSTPFNFTDNIPDGYFALDLGPKSINLFQYNLEGAKTIVWNGPLGVCEFENFANATKEIATYISNMDDVFSVIGGGDTISIIEKSNMQDKFSHISTGGGATMSFLENDDLVAFEVLR